MLKEWEDLVLKWLNCFGVGLIKSIKDIKELNFVEALSPNSSPTDDEPFLQLLTYLKNEFPCYDPSLSDTNENCWAKDEELFLLSSLLLLDASIYKPVPTLQNNAAERFDASEQELIVNFLQKVMEFEQKITKNELITCIPSVKGNSSTSQNSALLSPLPVVGKRLSGGLAEFLSSPVARNKRKSGTFRERLCTLESDLEKEQDDKAEMQERIVQQESKIAELVKKLNEKTKEVKALQEGLNQAEEGKEALTEEKGGQKAEKRRLRQQLEDSEQYAKKLEEEIGNLRTSQTSLEQKLTLSEEMCAELESIRNENREEISNLKKELEHCSYSNEELQKRCEQFERDMYQIQSSNLLSPRRPLLDSPNRTPLNSPAPENLGFIVEKEMIGKENEIADLQSSLKELDDELKEVTAAFKTLQEKSEKDTANSSRTQKKLESKLESFQKKLDTTSQELSLCKQEKDEINSKLSAILKERDEQCVQLEDLSSAKAALVAEHKLLTASKHELEKKVAKMEVKLLISGEKETELLEIAKKRLTDLEAMILEKGDMEVQLKKSSKEREMMEQQLNDTLKKLSQFQNMELKVDELEEQIMSLKQSNEDLEKKSEQACSDKKILEGKLFTLTEEKTAVELQLKDLTLKRNDLSAALDQMTIDKNSVAAENLALLKEKVRWDSEKQETLQHLQEMTVQIAREESEKKSIQDKLADALATNDRLTSQLSIITQSESDLANNLTDLLKQKKLIENQLASVTKEKDRLVSALEESSARFTEAHQETESLNFRLKNKTAELEHLTAKYSDLIKNKTEIETKFAEHKYENEELQSKLVKVTLNLELAQAELSLIKDQLEVLRQQDEEKSAAITDLQSEKADVEDDLSHYVTQLHKSDQENRCLKAELSLLKDQKHQLNLEYESVNQEKLDLEKKLRELESNFLSSENIRESLLSQLATASKEKEEISTELKNARNSIDCLHTELSTLQKMNSDQQSQLLDQSSQIEHLLHENENLKEDYTNSNKAMQDECDEKSQQLSLLKEDLAELQSSYESLVAENKHVKGVVEGLAAKNRDLEEELSKHISKIEFLSEEKQGTLEQLQKAIAEKEEALLWVESVETGKKELLSQLDSESKLKEEFLTDLKMKELHIAELSSSNAKNEELLSNNSENLVLLQQQNDKICNELKTALAEKDEISSRLEEHSTKLLLLQQEKDKIDEELKAIVAEKEEMSSCLQQLAAQKLMEESYRAESTCKIERLMCEIETLNSNTKLLEKEITEKNYIIESANNKIQDLQEKLSSSNADAEERFKNMSETKENVVSQNQKTEEMLKKLQVLNEQQRELLEKAGEEKKTLRGQIYELQGSIEVKEELLSETQICVEKLRSERDSLRDLLTVKDQIISCQKDTASSLERQSSDELEVAMKLLEGELQSSQSTSEMVAHELRKVQKTFEEEKLKLQEALKEAQSAAATYQQEAVALKQQLTSPQAREEIAELEQEESLWQLDRAKHQLEYQFESMMTQKVDVEEHLGQLREIIKDVSCTCDNLFAALPPNCDAVHEVTVMRKEVEIKLRAVDKKYADSLCGIISLANNMFKFTRNHTDQALEESGSKSKNTSLSSERESIEMKVSKSCEAMKSLTYDVRSVINSCKFLIERCESYLKAQTRESLKIKPALPKDGVEGVVNGITLQSSRADENKVSPVSKTPEEKVVMLDGNNSSPPAQDWFGGSTTLEEGYQVMKKSHSLLEEQITDLRQQLKELQSSGVQTSHVTEMARLKEKIGSLELRPTQEQLEEKLKELHVQYSNKLEGMKLKMKQIVKEEVQKVEDEKHKSEKEIVAKYSKRISEYEGHVQQLSAQLWELGEKLLQEQQDHKVAKERLVTLKERQRQYLMSKQRTQSLDRLDTMLQGTKEFNSSSQLKRRCNSQVAQSGLASAKVHPVNVVSSDEIDESSSRRSTMMAPASMGLAFPEEDEDGEVFNNDYLAELKEGKCRVPLNESRLSELQYRNSLCPPHLKSSYPAETQFQDPQMCRDEDIKGADGRLRRQGKDKGTTSYKRPGPPTPSKKAGRLSLQGKEDLTPRVAALREHNESQSSQGTGMLRVAKTTPSRLRALFSSSKVANAPITKKDEPSTPATPTSKRLSIFRRRAGGNKENKSALSGYASFH